MDQGPPQSRVISSNLMTLQRACFQVRTLTGSGDWNLNTSCCGHNLTHHRWVSPCYCPFYKPSCSPKLLASGHVVDILPVAVSCWLQGTWYHLCTASSGLPLHPPLPFLLISVSFVACRVLDPHFLTVHHLPSHSLLHIPQPSLDCDVLLHSLLHQLPQLLCPPSLCWCCLETLTPTETVHLPMSAPHRRMVQVKVMSTPRPRPQTSDGHTQHHPHLYCVFPSNSFSFAP